MKRKMKLIGVLGICKKTQIHNKFITMIMKGKINGKRTRGRPRKSFFEEIFRSLAFTSYQQTTT